MPVPAEPQLFTSVFLTDSRGDFSKPFHAGLGLEDFRIRELYWTTSSRGVIRGMHFQLPPTPIGKLAWVSRGSIIDVVVDLRAGATYGAVVCFALDAKTGQCVWIPAGFAHGFQALEDDTIVNYAVDQDFNPTDDAGVRFDSIDFDWPLPAGEISPRDRAQPTLEEFVTPW